MDLFWQRKEYSFQTPEIKKWLTRWFKNENWSIKEAVQFLQDKYKLETPIHFANLNMLRGTIDCIPNTGTAVTLQRFPKIPRDQVRIIIGNTTHCYDFETLPQLYFIGKIVRAHNGRCIRYQNRLHNYTYKMYTKPLDSQCCVELFITDSERAERNSYDEVTNYSDNIEAYLLNCKETDAISIYHKVCELIGFDYREIDNIHITYNLPKGISTTELTVTDIEVEYGKIVYCEAHIDSKRYKVTLSDEQWSWEYSDSEQAICFEFVQDWTNNAEETIREIEKDIIREERYEINPESLDNVLSEVPQTICNLLKMMG